MIDVIARLFPEKSLKQARQIAAGALATMVGSIVLARAVSDKELSNDILAAGRQVLRHPSSARRARG
jgi:TetR/AcrR family transcriptional regulator, transcriptional repressor for nem operon